MPQDKRVQRIGKEYVYAPGGFQMDWDGLSTMYVGARCYLVALDGKQIAAILALFKFLKFSHLWGFPRRDTWASTDWKRWDTITAFVAEMELCLMSGCDVADLVKAVRELTAVVGSQAVDLTQPIPDALDYSQAGVVHALNNLAGDPIGDMVTLEEVYSAFEADDIIQYPLAYGMLTVIRDILPTSLASQFKIRDPARFTLEMLQIQMQAILGIITAGANIAEVALDSGELVADVAESGISGLDTIFQGITAGALSLQDIIDLINLFRSSEGNPNPDDNPAVRTQMRANDILMSMAENLTELNRIRNALETTVVTQNGVQRQGIATALQENTDNLAYILDKIRDNLDVSIFDDGEGQIKEYSVTSVLFTRISEFIEVVDRVRDNLDAVVDTDTEIGLAAMLDAINLSAARINNSLRCVADALNAVCPDSGGVEPPYLRSGDVESKAEDDDWIAALKQLRDDLIDDESEGRTPFVDETDEDHHIADGTFTLIGVTHVSGPEQDTGYLLIDVTTNGKCELVFNVSGTSRTMVYMFLLPQEQVQMSYVPDTGTLMVLNEATGDTTSIGW